MRIRCKPWARPELEACPFFISDPKAHQNHWQEVFGNDKPIWLELGCGKGGFAAQAVIHWPDVNYIAIDIKNEMLVLAKRIVEPLNTITRRISELREGNLEFRMEDAYRTGDEIEELARSLQNRYDKTAVQKIIDTAKSLHE